MSDLPNWVYELVGGLITQREVHPKFLFESGAFEGTRQYDWCPCNSLEKVPEEVQGKAVAIREYKRELQADFDRSVQTLEEVMKNLGFSLGAIKHIKSQAEIIKAGNEE